MFYFQITCNISLSEKGWAWSPAQNANDLVATVLIEPTMRSIKHNQDPPGQASLASSAVVDKGTNLSFPDLIDYIDLECSCQWRQNASAFSSELAGNTPNKLCILGLQFQHIETHEILNCTMSSQTSATVSSLSKHRPWYRVENDTGTVVCLHCNSTLSYSQRSGLRYHRQNCSALLDRDSRNSAYQNSQKRVRFTLEDEPVHWWKALKNVSFCTSRCRGFDCFHKLHALFSLLYKVVGLGNCHTLCFSGYLFTILTGLLTDHRSTSII